MGKLRLGIAVVCALVACGVAAGPALAATDVVNVATGTGVGSLPYVIQNASPGDTIIFDVGNTTVTVSAPIPIDLLTSATLTIDGASNDGGPSVRITTAANDTGNVFSITSGNVTFDDITVTGLISDVDGGAIYVHDGNASDVVTVANSTFESDVTGGSHNGGAVANAGQSTVDVSGSTFDSDEAASDGGAIVNESSGTVSVDEGTLDNDRADDGGAIANTGTGTVSVDGSDLEQDTATFDGGAIDNDAGGTVTVSGGSTFEDDRADDGGAIAGDDGLIGTLNVGGSSFVGNVAASDGGAIDSGAGSSSGEALTVTDDTFTGNGAEAGDGGAIDDADNGGIGLASVSGSDFVGNYATIGDGGAIDNGDHGSPAAELSVWGSTFYGDVVASAADGAAIYDGGLGTIVQTEVAADLFTETCVGSVTSEGYNAAVPGGGAGIECAGGATGDQLDTAVTDVSSQGASGQFTLPDAPNPAIDLIPSGAQVSFFAGPETTLCPVTDLLGNSGPDSSGHCDAGAVQNYVPASSTTTNPGGGQGGSGSGSASGSGGGGTSTTTSTTSTTTETTHVAPKTTVTTTVKFDNQTITLVHPSMNVCTAAGKSLLATLTSKSIKHSKKPKLKFKLAAFTTGRKDKHSAKRVPAKESIKLKGLKAHRTDKLKVVVSYSKPRKHHKPAAVSKTITVKFKVC